MEGLAAPETQVEGVCRSLPTKKRPAESNGPRDCAHAEDIRDNPEESKSTRRCLVAKNDRSWLTDVKAEVEQESNLIERNRQPTTRLHPTEELPRSHREAVDGGGSGAEAKGVLQKRRDTLQTTNKIVPSEQSISDNGTPIRQNTTDSGEKTSAVATAVVSTAGEGGRRSSPNGKALWEAETERRTEVDSVTLELNVGHTKTDVSGVTSVSNSPSLDFLTSSFPPFTACSSSSKSSSTASDFFSVSSSTPSSSYTSSCTSPNRAISSSFSPSTAIDYLNLNSGILAPMVKMNVLAFRLECLQYGADIVYSEELIARKLLNCVRKVNADFGGIVEYISPPTSSSSFSVYSNRHDGPSPVACTVSTAAARFDGAVEHPSSLKKSVLTGGELVLSTDKELEAGRLVVQLGVADNVTALSAAQIVLQDAVAIDINMGCPKSFSVKGGMGAALLDNPTGAADILKTLKRNLPCDVSCKIRLLSEVDGNGLKNGHLRQRQNYMRTVEFAKLCEFSGASAIALHARERHERPAHSAHWGALPVVKAALSVPLIANGDFLSKQDVAAFYDSIGDRSIPIMYARAAVRNPSVFAQPLHLAEASCVRTTGNSAHMRFDCGGLQEDNAERPSGVFEYTSAESTNQTPPRKLSIFCILQRLMKRCVTTGNPYQSSKYLVQSILAQDTNLALKSAIQMSKTTKQLCEALQLTEWYQALQLPSHANTLMYYQALARRL